MALVFFGRNTIDRDHSVALCCNRLVASSWCSGPSIRPCSISGLCLDAFGVFMSAPQRDPFSPAPRSLAASCCSYRYGAIAVNYIRASCVVSSPSVDSCSPICSSAYRCVRVCFSCTRSNSCHVVYTHAWSQCFATQKYRFPYAMSFDAVAKPHASSLS